MEINMIELGKVQELTVVKTVDFGVYLGEKMDAGNRFSSWQRAINDSKMSGNSVRSVFAMRKFSSRLNSSSINLTA